MSHIVRSCHGMLSTDVFNIGEFLFPLPTDSSKRQLTTCNSVFIASETLSLRAGPPCWFGQRKNESLCEAGGRGNGESARIYSPHSPLRPLRTATHFFFTQTIPKPAKLPFQLGESASSTVLYSLCKQQ